MIHTAAYDQVADILGVDYHVVHHHERENDGQGISIASRWPIMQVHEVNLHVASRSAGFACSTLVAEILTPEPIGPLVFINHFPDWQLTHEYEREVQTVTVARFIENLIDDRNDHVVLAGDFDATPDAATIRFWAGLQSLGELSVCYRDTWASTHPTEAGHTFTPDNLLVTMGETGDWELELGRRIDYIFVRCSDHGPTLKVTDATQIFDRAIEGVWASDHIGVAAGLSPNTPGEPSHDRHPPDE